MCHASIFVGNADDTKIVVYVTNFLRLLSGLVLQTRVHPFIRLDLVSLLSICCKLVCLLKMIEGNKGTKAAKKEVVLC